MSDPDPDHRQGPQRPELGELTLKVESLGASWELGLVQRHCMIDQPGLFRFGYTPFDGLVRALDAGLDDVGLRRALRADVGENSDYIAVHQDYGFEFHTKHIPAGVSEADLIAKMAIHLGFLARKLRDDLGKGEKLFVYRPESHEGSGDNARRLCEAMGRFGNAVLLWVELTDDPAKFGTAEWTEPGRLITGYLDWCAKTKYAETISFDCWVSMLQAAVGLWERMPARYEAGRGAARRARADGDYVAAFQILAQLLERFPDRPEPFVDAAALFSDLGRPNDAEALLALGLARLPDNPVLVLEHERLTNAQSGREVV